jgi:acetoacetate decarboxylase
MIYQKTTSDYDKITFPPLPWTLKGDAFISVGLVDIEEAKKYVPYDMKIISIIPGKTFGGLYLAKYNKESTLEYNELLIVCAVAKYSDKTGLWISNAYVDDLSAWKSGHKMWGWHKEMAVFDREEDSKTLSVKVRQKENVICSVTYKKFFAHLNMPTVLPVFGTVEGDIRWFRGKGKMDTGFTGAKIEIPESSPFSGLKLKKPIVSFDVKTLDLVYPGLQVLKK